MKNFEAKIQWVPYDRGGRKSLPDIGIMYFPHIILEKDIYQTPWSVAFIITPCEYDRKCTISFRMLVDNEGTQQFLAGISSGDRFRLYEGKRLVALGIIV